MKKLLLSMLFVSTMSFGQIKIEPVATGWPSKQATDLMVRVMPFETDAKTCSLYYELKSADMEVLANGNLQLTEAEFEAWGQLNSYLEDLALSRLYLQRKQE